MQVFHNLAAIWRAGRFWKNLPLLITFLSGIACIKPFELPDVWVIAVASVAVITISIFMTHVNVITDHELDLKRKPELFNDLMRSPKLAKSTVGFELIFSVTLLSVLVWAGFGVSAFYLSVFGLAAILYSYNLFLPSPTLAKKHRLKVYWWGHIVVVVLGYIALWLGGFSLNGSASFSDRNVWFWSFVLISLSEYSVFLLESSIDTDEEAEHEIKSLSALLGYRHTNMVSIGINVLAIICLIGCVWNAADQMRILWCFVPPMIVRSIYEVYMLRVTDKQRRYRLLRQIPDLIFNLSRAYILVALIFVP